MNDLDFQNYLLTKKPWFDKINDVLDKLFSLNEETFKITEKILLDTHFSSTYETTMNFFDIVSIAYKSRPKYSNLYKKLLMHFDEPLKKYGTNKTKIYTSFHSNPNFVDVIDSKNNEEDNLITIIKDDNIDEFTNKFSNMKQNIDEKYDYSKMSMRLINWAASFGSIKIFKFLILSKAELDDELINAAVFGGSLDIIKILENEGKKLTESQLVISVRAHHNKISDYIINLLYGDGTNNIKDDAEIPNEVFSASIEYYNPKFFVDYLDFIDSPSLLFDCAKCHHLDMLDILLHIPDFDVNYIHNDTYSIIHEVVRMNNPIYVKYVINCSNIDVNKICYSNTNNYTALHIAVLQRNVEAVKLLLTREDLNVNAVTTITNETALHFACRNNSHEIIRLLINDERSNKSIKKHSRFFQAQTPLDIILDHRKYNIFFEMRNAGFLLNRFFLYVFIFQICLFSFCATHLMLCVFGYGKFRNYYGVLEIGTVMRFLLKPINDLIFDQND